MSQDYHVNWGSGGIKPGFIARANIDFPIERTDLLGAFIQWGLTKPELMSIRTYDRRYQSEQSTTNPEIYEMIHGRKSTSPMFPDNRPPP